MLTPRHLFRQLEPSWLVNGHTTSLLASEAEKELVKEDLGGMAGRIGECGMRLRVDGRLQLLLLDVCQPGGITIEAIS